MLLHNLLHENWGGCFGKEEYYRNTGETADRVEHRGGCVGTADFYRRTREDVLIQAGTTGALGRPCWDGRML